MWSVIFLILVSDINQLIKIRKKFSYGDDSTNGVKSNEVLDLNTRPSKTV